METQQAWQGTYHREGRNAGQEHGAPVLEGLLVKERGRRHRHDLGLCVQRDVQARTHRGPWSDGVLLSVSPPSWTDLDTVGGEERGCLNAEHELGPGADQNHVGVGHRRQVVPA